MRVTALRRFAFSYCGRVYAAQLGDEIEIPDDLFARPGHADLFRTAPGAPVAAPAPAADLLQTLDATIPAEQQLSSQPARRRGQPDRKSGRGGD